ncbi:MAG TPA: DUF1778 domain-containing protein [Chloroflexota bacterium]|jgi:hypothetical protein|nr:DUF1778 domain-containing protein [Chloroflexota bacterium]
MRSIRIDPDVDERIRRAAAAEDASVSEFTRRALDERAERTLRDRPSTRERLADVIGIVHGGGGRADETGKAFKELLTERHQDP